MNDSVNGNGSGNEITSSRLAALVGFEEVSSGPNVMQEVTPVSPDTEPDKELKVEDPRDIQTQRPPWTKPFNKAGFVLGGTSILMLTGYLFMDNLTNPVTKRTQPPTLQEFPVPTEQFKQKDETGLLKAEVALGDQTNAMQKLNKANNSKPTPAVQRPAPTSQKPTSASSPRSVAAIPREYSPAQAVAVTPAAVRAVPVRPAALRPVTVRAAPVKPAAVYQSPRQLPLERTVPTQKPSVRLEKDPMEQWLASAQLGSYGQMPMVAKPIGAKSSEVGYQQAVDSALSSSTTIADLRQQAAVNDLEEAPILLEQRRQSVKVGTQAKAILATPFAWDSAQHETIDDRFTIILVDSLNAADRSVALPAKTQLITALRSLSGTGMVRLVAVAAIVEQGGQLTEIALPENAIQIRGAAGKPLQAKQLHNKGGEIARMDAGRVLFGAIRKGAEIFNRTRSQSIVSGFGGFSSTTENRDPNLLAGVLEGGSEAILNDLNERNKRAIQAIEQRPNTWFLPAGTEVQIFVNQSVFLNGINQQILQDEQLEPE